MARCTDSAPAAGTRGPAKVDPALLDSWLRMRRRRLGTASVGQDRRGHGDRQRSRRSWPRSSTCRRAVTIVMATPATTVDQRGTRLVQRITDGARLLRGPAPKARGAARARLGALKVPAGQLRGPTGCFAPADSSKRVSYGELVARRVRRDDGREVRTKDPKTTSVAGGPRRVSTFREVRGSTATSATARCRACCTACIRPPEAGAKLLRVDRVRRAFPAW